MLTDRLTLRGEYAYAHSVGSVTTKLDSENCCSQTRDSQTFRVGLAYFLR
jgi:opacity protein-like surface antigen